MSKNDEIARAGAPYEVPLLNEREKTHGDYEVNAHMSQGLKSAMMNVNWHHLKAYQKESLHLIATKIGRILSGDPACVDHWEDIAGYANLVVAKLKH